MIKYIYFTATNTTQKVMETLGADRDNSLNITLRTPSDEQLCFEKEDVLYLGFPVFGGRVPAIVLERLNHLKGNGCKAVVTAVYGNRHYDDAIKEMQAFAEQHGCNVVAAIAAVAQHSIAPTIATGRPDATDIMRLKEIRKEIEERLKGGTLEAIPHRPEEEYKEYRQLPVFPETTEDCVLCGTCADQCPVQAINISDTCSTIPSRCILCMRCVAVCPAEARRLPHETLQAITARIESRCNGRRETEVFWG